MSDGVWNELVGKLRGTEYQFGLISPTTATHRIEFDDGLTGFLNFAAHAPTHVENDSDRDRSIFAGEVLDLLRIFAFHNGEVFAVEPGDKAVQRIGDGDWNEH